MKLWSLSKGDSVASSCICAENPTNGTSKYGAGLGQMACSMILKCTKVEMLTWSRLLALAVEVEMKLCASLPRHKNHKVYADDFFTDIPLVNQWEIDGIHYVGTIRSNRLHGCHVKDEKILKKRAFPLIKWEKTYLKEEALDYAHVNRL